MPLKTPFKLALITGATSGIGLALARKLASQEIDLIVTGRNQEALEDLAQELQNQVKVIPIVADLSFSEERKVLVELIHSKKPDLVINNAGLGFYGRADESSVEDELTVIQVNIEALTELTLETIQTLHKEGNKGVILNVSSAAAFAPFPSLAVYAATKAYVNSFSEALHAEWSEKGISVLTACPGRVATNFSKRASRGLRSSKEEGRMTPEYAAEEIWWQIIRKKRIHVFSFKYFILSLMMRVLPYSLLMMVLKRIRLKAQRSS